MIKFAKGAGGNALVFPLSQKQIDGLKPCKLHSPKVGKSYGIKNVVAGNEQLLLDEVLEVVAMVQRGEFPFEFMRKYYPKKWGEFPDEIPEPLKAHNLSFDRPRQLANIVEMDSPSDMPRAVMRWIHSLGIFPNDARSNCIDFLEIIPETERKLSQALERNLAKAFEIKYYYGQARPEEVAGFNMTAYADGCPNHPSFPAGHGAAASSVSILIDRYPLNDAQIKIIRDTAYCWSMFRTFAGVHYGPDNIAGLMCGGVL